MQIPVEIVAGLIVVWIGLQFSMLKRIGKLETQAALSRERHENTRRFINDLLRYFANKPPRPPSINNPDAGHDPGYGDPANGINDD